MCVACVICVWFVYHLCISSTFFHELVVCLCILGACFHYFFVNLLCVFLHFLRVVCACVSRMVSVSCLRVPISFYELVACVSAFAMCVLRMFRVGFLMRFLMNLLRVFSAFGVCVCVWVCVLSMVRVPFLRILNTV